MSEVECEAWHSGLQGSYLLLFVGFGSPAPNRTGPASKDCCQVLPSSLFTVQFNHILKRTQPLTFNCHNSHELGPGGKVALINIFISTLNQITTCQLKRVIHSPIRDLSSYSIHNYILIQIYAREIKNTFKKIILKT